MLSIPRGRWVGIVVAGFALVGATLTPAFAATHSDVQTNVPKSCSIKFPPGPPPTVSPMAVMTPSLPDARVNQSYRLPFGVAGCPGPYAWSIAGGTLPTGLALSSGGVLTGQPVTAGTYTFSVEVADGETDPATTVDPVSLVVQPPITVTTTTLPNAEVGLAYDTTLTQQGSTAHAVWSVSNGSLPNGLTLSASGLIMGTPTQSGASTFTVTVTTPGGYSASQSLTLNVSNPALAVATNAIPSASVGASYSVTLTATGGQGPYTWSLTPGTALPAGLSLSTSGTLSGTPTAAGADAFGVVVQDASGATASLPMYLKVHTKSTITIVSHTLTNATAGQLYSAPLSASGGDGTYTWSLAANATLPTGLTLSPSGIIGGTPTTIGTYTFTVVATDIAGNTAQGSLTITIQPGPLVITTSQLPAGSANVAYQATLQATGGTGADVWALKSGSSLPAGLNLSSSGVLSGTPTSPGTSDVSVTVTDSAGQSASIALSLTIGPANSLVLVTTALPQGTLGAPYRTTLEASGGQAPYTWYLNPRSNLPPGLSLNQYTGEISGTPTEAGTFSLTVYVSDSESVPVQVEETLSLTIASSLAIQTSSMPVARFDIAYNLQLVATGGTGSYTWSIVYGQLPDGLDLSTAGRITGLPLHAGTFPLKVQVTDSTGASSQQSLTLTVEADSPIRQRSKPSVIWVDQRRSLRPLGLPVVQSTNGAFTIFL